VVLAKGYGVKSSNKRKSGCQYFIWYRLTVKLSSASLAILVDEGKIKWDDKVIKYLLILKCTMIM
jgi:hypothetical protein